MRTIKQNFLAALALLAITAPAAYAVPEFELPPEPLSPAALAPDSLPDRKAVAADQARQAADSRAVPALIPEPSSWTMLLAGAGVLLLPRRRGADNAVR